MTLGIAVAATDPLTSALVAAVGAAAIEAGFATRWIGDIDDEAHVETLLTVGRPQGWDHLLAAPRRSRRIAWFGEPLPRSTPGQDLRSIDAGTGARRLVGPALAALRGPATRLQGLPLPPPLGRMRAAAYIEDERRSNLAAAVRCAAVVDRVVVTSHDRRAVLAANGVDAAVVPFGYHPAHAGPMVTGDVTRDLEVVAFGSGLDWDSRRATGLRTCVAALGRDRVRVLDGAWGSERHALLQRARVLLDVHRIPGNFIGLRILLAAAAGAVLVTEPMDDPAPFVPGRHHVEAPIEDLPDAVAALLDDEPRRREIVAETQALLAGPLSMAASVRAVLG